MYLASTESPEATPYSRQYKSPSHTHTQLGPYCGHTHLPFPQYKVLNDDIVDVTCIGSADGHLLGHAHLVTNTVKVQ